MTTDTAPRTRQSADGTPFSQDDLNLKTQVSISVPMGLVFKLEDAADKDSKGNPLVGALVASIVAEKFGYTLPAGRNRAKMSEDEKKAKAKAAAEEKANKIKELQNRYRSTR